MTAPQDGWLWIVAALVLAVAELLLPGYVFLGTALASGVMGLLILIGLWSAGLPASLVTAAVLSGLIWPVLSRMAGSSRGSVRIWRRDINED